MNLLIPCNRYFIFIISYCIRYSQIKNRSLTQPIQELYDIVSWTFCLIIHRDINAEWLSTVTLACPYSGVTPNAGIMLTTISSVIRTDNNFRFVFMLPLSFSLCVHKGDLVHKNYNRKQLYWQAVVSSHQSQMH